MATVAGAKNLVAEDGPPVKPGVDVKFHHKAEDEMRILDLAGVKFSELGRLFNKTLQTLNVGETQQDHVHGKGSISSPTSGVQMADDPERQRWLDAILRGMNSLYGCSQSSTTSVSALRKELMVGLLKFLDRMMKWETLVPQMQFEDLFRVKSIDNWGEEVKLAVSFSWDQIEGAVPDGVATLDIEKFCLGGCRHYVEDFNRFLVPPDQQQLGRTPRVMVRDGEWDRVAEGLLKKGICGVLPKSQLHHVGSEVLLNGLFAVSKNEVVQGVELRRLIMNLFPLNRLCLSPRGDVGTLPTIAGFSSYYLAEGEVALLCSEDVRCFYYLSRIPDHWRKFMGFARELPKHLVPAKWKNEACYLVSRVLPMGWANSVGLAQHIHRNVVRWSMEQEGLKGGEGELGRDKGGTLGPGMYRVYLDNWDAVRRMDRRLAQEVEGKPSAQQLALRRQYELLGLPRRPKKAVENAFQAEIQGALFDGDQGVAYATPDKVMKYVGLTWALVERGGATQRELQGIAGGLVCISMFRRALLSSLNAIWRHIEELSLEPPVVRRAIPREVKMELIRFLCLVPLAQMDFRLEMQSQVTASDASSTGGGVSASVGLSSFGIQASKAWVRGERVEPFDHLQILTVGLFDGVSALRVAVDLLELPVAGHVSVECHELANLVVQSAFPGCVHLSRVQDVTKEEGLGVRIASAGADRSRTPMPGCKQAQRRQVRITEGIT